MSKYRRRGFALLFILFFILFPVTASAPVHADGQPGSVSRTVRVAYPVQRGLSDFDEYGERTGYTYEYLEEIAQYTGWDYEFVEAEGSPDESITQLMKMVRTGEADLMGAIRYTESLAADYDYSSYHYGQSETVLQVLNEDVGEHVISSRVQQTFRIAVIKGSTRSIKELEDYCKMNLVTPVYVECETAEEQLEALRSERADMLLNKSLNYIGGVQTIASFAIEPFYFVTTKGGDPMLMEELNSALMNIAQSDPYFSTRLYEKYFSPKSGNIHFSEAEQAYVASAGTLRVGILADAPPYQYEENGEFRGISYDTLKLAGEKTGLSFEAVRAATPDELYEKAKNSEIDLVAGISYDYELARRHNLAMSRSYVSAQYLLMMKNTTSEADLRGKRLALTTSSTYEGETLGVVTKYPTVGDCIRAIAKGEADYTYVDAYTAQYYINLPEYKNMKVIQQTYEPRSLCFGVVKPVSAELLSILNKCIAGFTETETQGIINSNLLRPQSFSLVYFIRENPVESICILIGIFVLIIAVLLVVLIGRAKRNRKNALELKKHFRVYALVNEYFFEYDYRKQQLIVSIPPEEGAGQPELRTFDFRDAVREKEEGERKSAFLDVILSQENGVKEAYLSCIDGARHWLRFALETVYDGDTPAYVLGKINVIDEEKVREEELMERAQLDSLTHLYNAETSTNLIRAGLSGLCPGESGTLLLLDVDRFKSINDTFGHLRGDEVLIETAKILKAVFPENAVVGRPGGDEFVVFLSRTESRESLFAACDELVRRAGETEIGEGRSLSFSIGVAFTRPGEEYDPLYRRADAALYRAKEHGRGRYEIAEE